MQRSDLPFGSEFSPNQVDLLEVLELAKQHAGDWHAFEAAVRARYFQRHNTSDYNRNKLANNTRLGMIAYGIINRDATLTPFGESLFEARGDSELLYRLLGRHILVNLPGLTLVQCVEDMQAAAESVSLVKLREWLDQRGVHFPRGGHHPSTMKLWLEKAGVFLSNSWRVNHSRVAEIVGASSEEFEALATLSREQRAFVRTLINLGEPGPFLSNRVERLAAATYGVKFNEKNLAKAVLYPLREAGLVALERGTRDVGRGAKPFLVRWTDKLHREVVEPLLDQLDRQVGADVRPFLRRSFADILREVKSGDRYRRGLALEALAFKITRLVDLDYVATRLRGTVTGGAEVDLIVESSRLMFARWQIQCKNVASGVTLDDVAKEVGLTHMLKSNVVVVVSTGSIGHEARRYASIVMKESNLDIALLDSEDLERIQSDPSSILELLNREAQRAMRLKTLDLTNDGTPPEDSRLRLEEVSP